MSTLNVKFTNYSNVADSSVYIGFAPGSSGAATTISNLNDNSTILAVNTSAGNGNWYTLDKLTKGVGITSFSGRIYVCYDTPWKVSGPGQEPAQAVTDENFFLRYDKMEITFTGQSTDVADLTSIDYWSIPMRLISLKSGMPVQMARGLKNGATTQSVFSALNALTTPPVSGVAGPGGTDGTPLPALVPGQYQQFGTGPAPLSSFARIIGPSSYPPVYPAPAIPVMPYDLLTDYLDSLLRRFGPGTNPDVTPGLGNGVIAHIAGSFGGVGPDVPPTGPKSMQAYSLTARIDRCMNITLKGTTGSDSTTMLYKAEDLQNPTGIYGGNAPFYLNGAGTPTTPGNDVYGWIGGDLFSGLNIGAVGSTVTVPSEDLPAGVSDVPVGVMESHVWFKLKPKYFFAYMQPDKPYYNQWAATLQKMSDAYNFAYTDRFAPVLVKLDPAEVDQLEIGLDDATVDMS